MAEIRPFRALRYDPGKVRLEDVVTQPYDKITPDMQQGYYQRSPVNFVRFELRLPDGQDPYEGAKAFLAQMRDEGILKLEEHPALYVYEQEFFDPGDGQQKITRRALICAGRLHDYSDGIIFRHEQTLTGPKRDREQLLQTTRTQSGLLFMLYDDPRRTLEQLPSQDAVEFVDDLGIKQRLWAISDRATIQHVQQLFRDQRLFIADGHHRYETALSLRRSNDGRYAEDFAMMALVNMRSEGVVVMATHRVIFGVGKEKLRTGLQRLRNELGMREWGSADAAVKGLDTADAEQFATMILDGKKAYLVSLGRGELQQRLGGHSCELDVEALHLIFAQYFGITPGDVAGQRHVRYHRYAADALQDVRAGAQAAFLIRPVPIDVIRDRSLRGALMPQKSTDFYPKMNSGLTLYSWDESFVEPTVPEPVTVERPREV